MIEYEYTLKGWEQRLMMATMVDNAFFRRFNDHSKDFEVKSTARYKKTIAELQRKIQIAAVDIARRGYSLYPKRLPRKWKKGIRNGDIKFLIKVVRRYPKVATSAGLKDIGWGINNA